jgi:hypothetical protein
MQKRCSIVRGTDLVADTSERNWSCRHDGSSRDEMTTPQLSLGEYKRYGRQMILDGFGLEGSVHRTRSECQAETEAMVKVN